MASDGPTAGREGAAGAAPMRLDASIRLDTFLLEDISKELLVGRMTMQQAIDRAHRVARHVCGDDRPRLMVPFPSDVMGKRLCLAWLNQYGKLSDEFDGKHLLVMWLQKGDPLDPLQTALQHVQDHGGWNTLAKAYDL